MKKVFKIFMAVVILLSLSTPVFAAVNTEVVNGNAVVNGDVVNEIQKQDTQYVKDTKKVSDVIDEVNQSVVAVIGRNTKYRQDTANEFSKIPTNVQHGSGVVVSKDGRIITNNHVIDGLDEIYVVTYDGNVYKAQCLYADQQIDLALLKINRTDLKPMKFAEEKKYKSW